jgi:GDP-4-dehydro-6-deoxy-D-mannose reductase
MRVLITCGTGFVGKHVVECLRKKGHEVIIGTRGFTKENSVQFFLNDCFWIDMMLHKLNVDAIIHLSGKASVKSSFDEPFETYKSNIKETINLLKIVLEKYKNIRLIIAGSSEIYKPCDEILTEQSLLGPVSPYGFTKVFIDCFSRSIALKNSMNLVVTRPFNTIGPGQSDNYVISNFAKQIVEIKLGKKDKILEVGNVEVFRDFVDVRDVARAYANLLEGHEIGEVYNICSNNKIGLLECIKEMLKLEELEDVIIKIDKTRFRLEDVKSFVGAYGKIEVAYGWKPMYPIDQTLYDILLFWKKELTEEIDEHSFCI